MWQGKLKLWGTSSQVAFVFKLPIGQAEFSGLFLTLKFHYLRASTYVLTLRSHTSTAPSFTQANTVEDLGDQAMSYTGF